MSNKNIFCKTSDTKTIIRFVKEIERHPCLYDQKSPLYTDRELKRKTWIYIAKKANSTVADCKDKWTKIRTAYIRTLRPSYNDGIRTFGRPYYLANHLKFIRPMKRHGARFSAYPPHNSENEQQDQENNEVENIEDDQSDDVDDHSDSQNGDSQHQVFVDEDNNSFDGIDEDIMGYHNIAIDTNAKASDMNEGHKSKIKERRSNQNEYNNEVNGKQKSCYENIEYNPRKMFVFSLLPDIEDLDEQQMRYFRREVIKLIDNIMSE